MSSAICFFAGKKIRQKISTLLRDMETLCLYGVDFPLLHVEVHLLEAIFGRYSHPSRKVVVGLQKVFAPITEGRRRASEGIHTRR